MITSIRWSGARERKSTLHKVFAIALIAAFLLPLALRPRTAEAGASPLGASLRLLTYNTAFTSADVELPPPAGVYTVEPNDAVFSSLSYKARAKAIAAKLLETDNDIIVLNEVFSADARAIFVEELAKKSLVYPHYIARIKSKVEKELTVAEMFKIIVGSEDLPDVPSEMFSTVLVHPGDSGLMVFSRYPFVSFSDPASPIYDVEIVEGWNNGAQWGGPNELSFRHYEDCIADDCFASKGVGMVRVAAPSGIVNVAFTHMQADYLPKYDGAPTRALQFQAVEGLIRSSLTPNELKGQQVYLMGDLNVPGGKKYVGSPAGTSEWAQLFDVDANTNGLFACGNTNVCTYDPVTQQGTVMTDSWGHETAPEDKGISNYNDKTRLDYIVHSKPRNLCLQHVMLAYDLGYQGGIEQLSDHLGVRADVNNKALHCSPNETAGQFGPKPLSFGAQAVIKEDINTGAQITFPGSMQWYRIEVAGTYSFDITQNDEHVDYAVYQASNLSNPIPAYEKSPFGRADTYALPDPPYYIRVYGAGDSGKADRTFFGPYTMNFRQFRGLSQFDALALTPGYEYPYSWATVGNGNIISPDQEIWFQFKTDTSSDGAFPEVDFLQENTNNSYAPDSFTARLIDDSAGLPTIPTNVVKDLGPGAQYDFDDDFYIDQMVKAPDLAGSGSGPKRYFITLKRDASLANVQLTSLLEFRTTLTYFRTHLIKVYEENTWGPAPDDIMAQWSYDNDPWGPMACAQVICMGPFYQNDDATWQPWEPQFHKSYVKQLVPSLFDDYFDTNSPFKLEPQDKNKPGIDTYASNAMGVDEGEFVWSDSTDIYNKDDAGYWYTMYYFRSHEAGVLETYQPNP